MSAMDFLLVRGWVLCIDRQHSVSAPTDFNYVGPIEWGPTSSFTVVCRDSFGSVYTVSISVDCGRLFRLVNAIQRKVF